MSRRAMPAAESHSNSDDTWTSQLDQRRELRNDKDSNSLSADRWTSQQEQPRDLRNGKEPRGWTTAAEWTIYIQEISDDDRRSPSVVSIFRVPNILIEYSKKGEAYVPNRVSLGPYHHRSREFPLMDNHKRRALRRLMTRFNDKLRNDPKNIDFSVRAKEEIVQLEEEIRNNYAEEIHYEGEVLAEMLTLDGCFLVEILRTLGSDKVPVAEGGNYYEPIFKRTKILYTGFDILHDILKLENQIPLIVLRKLLELELNSADAMQELFKELVPSFLVWFYPFDYKKDIEQCSQLPVDEHVPHLLGLLHALIVSTASHNVERARDAWYSTSLPSEGEGNAVNDKGKGNVVNGKGEGNAVNGKGNPANGKSEDNPVNGATYNKIRKWWDQIRKYFDKDEDNVGSIPRANIPRAIELRNAGIKFRRCHGGIKNIKFDMKSATIFLPPIRIGDSTEIVFRNLIAFEMCKPSETNYVACYACLMEKLIDSEEDVALLTREGIITNGLGTDGEVAQLFNDLCKGVVVNLRVVFEQLREKVNTHCQNKFNVYRAVLLKEYFSSPWKILGLAAATVLLLLTAVQTIFTMHPLHK